MQRVVGRDLERIRPFYDAAARVAREATCSRARCGTVIVSEGEIIGSGYNGSPLQDEENRTCRAELDLSIKPKYDKTCCIHAEWRAILSACKMHAAKIGGATLYFMRVDDSGDFTDAGPPYCTVCSRLALEAGIGQFALWNRGAAEVYDAREYNQSSYLFYMDELRWSSG